MTIPLAPTSRVERLPSAERLRVGRWYWVHEEGDEEPDELAH